MQNLKAADGTPPVNGNRFVKEGGNPSQTHCFNQLLNSYGLASIPASVNVSHLPAHWPRVHALKSNVGTHTIGLNYRHKRTHSHGWQTLQFKNSSLVSQKEAVMCFTSCIFAPEPSSLPLPEITAHWLLFSYYCRVTPVGQYFSFALWTFHLVHLFHCHKNPDIVSAVQQGTV